MAVAENKNKKSGLTGTMKKYEYEVILLVYLLARFVFKNILGLAKYFTAQPVLDLSNALNIALGSTFILAICIYIASVFGQLIRKNGKDLENATLIFVAFYFACPVTLPFLFNTNSLSGTQMLYPFALFVFSVYLIKKQYIRWLIPLNCALYFIPTVHSSENFFIALNKGAILYVPLILLFLFLDMAKKHIGPGDRKAKSIKNNAVNSKNNSAMWDNSYLFRISIIVSIGAYIYVLSKGNLSFGETFYGTAQKIDIYLIVCLLISTPALVTACAVIYKSIKNKFPLPAFIVFFISHVMLFPLFWNNYYGLWIPFFIMSLFFFAFYNIWQMNPAMLFAVKALEDFFSKRKPLLFFFLIAMATLSNTSMIYASSFLLKIVSHIPY